MRNSTSENGEKEKNDATKMQQRNSALEKDQQGTSTTYSTTTEADERSNGPEESQQEMDIDNLVATEAQQMGESISKEDRKETAMTSNTAAEAPKSNNTLKERQNEKKANYSAVTRQNIITS